ncbi:MAG TPA: hypothetical protein VKB84_08355 [Candidatus Binataceae bacterium]|nr:hypothetical protein [Candidatus Binataceae bacterium]
MVSNGVTKNGNAAEVNGAPLLPFGLDLVQTVRQIALDQSLAAFDRSRHIAERVQTELQVHGSFFRTHGGRLFYFSDSERRLLDLHEARFLDFLKAQTGLGATEGVLRFVLDRLDNAAKQAKAIEIQSLSYYDPETGRLVVSNGGRGAWRRERGGEWTRGLNGEDDIFFITDLDADSWEPEFKASEFLDDFEWFLNRFKLTNFTHRVSREDQVSWLGASLRQWFFPALRGNQMIPAFFGTQGTFKTTSLRLIGRLLIGPRFEVCALSGWRHADFVAAVSTRVVLALDNVDCKPAWLQDAISNFATGARFEAQRHGLANEAVSVDPTARLMVSSGRPFGRADIAERVLPLFCGRPERFVPDSVLFDELASRRSRIMGDLLRSLGSAADRFAQAQPKAGPLRMADFGWFILGPSTQKNDSEKTNENLRLLEELQKAQGLLSCDADDVIVALNILLNQAGDDIGPIFIGELFEMCKMVARENQLSLPATVQGFGQRLTNLKPVIELELKARFIDERRHSNMRCISILRNPDKTKRARKA